MSFFMCVREETSRFFWHERESSSSLLRKRRRSKIWATRLVLLAQKAHTAFPHLRGSGTRLLGRNCRFLGLRNVHAKNEPLGYITCSDRSAKYHPSAAELARTGPALLQAVCASLAPDTSPAQWPARDSDHTFTLDPSSFPLHVW